MDENTIVWLIIISSEEPYFGGISCGIELYVVATPEDARKAGLYGAVSVPMKAKEIKEVQASGQQIQLVYPNGKSSKAWNKWVEENKEFHSLICPILQMSQPVERPIKTKSMPDKINPGDELIKAVFGIGPKETKRK